MAARLYEREVDLFREHGGSLRMAEAPRLGINRKPRNLRHAAWADSHEGTVPCGWPVSDRGGWALVSVLAAALCAAAGCSCARSHERDAALDASRARDGGHDGGMDAGRDAGLLCRPNPAYWPTEAGFPLRDGGFTPYCDWNERCVGALQWNPQACRSGVCCNGDAFDIPSCTCTCGGGAECPRGWVCCPETAGAVPRCVLTAYDCVGGSEP